MNIEIYYGDTPIRYSTFKFPAGEVQVNIHEDDIHMLDKAIHNVQPLQIVARLYSAEDITVLELLNNAVNKLLALPGRFHRVLTLPYLPYARQDRVCSLGEAFSLEVMASRINNMKFDVVVLYDPHSEVSSMLISNSCVVPQNEVFKEAELLYEDDIESTYDYFCSPEAGATKKILPLCREFGKELIEATKERCVKTGKIVRTKVHTDQVLEGKSVLIVDAICHGGRTFIELAKVLKKDYNVSTVGLYVTHGIFSKGFDEVLKWIDTVYTTDTYFKLDNPAHEGAMQNEFLQCAELGVYYNETI